MSSLTEMPRPEDIRMDRAALDARFTSSWTTRQKLGRVLWHLVQATLFRFSPQPCYRWRNLLLRLFGAQVHPTARLRPTVQVEVPWHLAVGPDTAVGDDAILYCLGVITLGARVTVSQYAHLCAGDHDYTRVDFPLIRLPITVEDDVWLATDVFVGPGVRVGAGAVVGARSSVFSDLPAWKVCVGSPARAIKDRILKSPEA